MNAPSIAPLKGRDLAEYGVVRLRDQAFDAVRALWRKRHAAGLTQKDLADSIGRDPAWVSKNLRAPGNWTLRTIGELAQGLNGEVQINVIGAEEPIECPTNFYAYDAIAAFSTPTPQPRALPSPMAAQSSIAANRGKLPDEDRRHKGLAAR